MDEWLAAILGRLIGRILKILILIFDDILFLAGCVCILYGLSLWNVVVTWIVAGIMLIGAGLIFGKVKL